MSLWNTINALGGKKFQIGYFLCEGRSIGHKVIDLGVI